MVKTNIQTFTGEVEVLEEFYVGSNLVANDVATHVLTVNNTANDAKIKSDFFVGDGGLLSNIATTLQSIADQGNAASNVILFNSNTDVTGYKNVGFVTTSNVGIQNTAPTHTMSIGDKIIIDNNTDESQGESVMLVHGRISADRFQGDGGLLSNIATTLESIADQGNASSNVLIFNSNTDISGYRGVGFVTTSNVGIQNTNPGFNTLSVGSNLFVNIYGSNVLTVHGNAAVSNLLVSEFSVSPAHGLQHVTQEGRATNQTVQLTNTTTGLEVSSNINVAGEVILTNATKGLDVTSNIEIGGRLKFDTNVFVDTLRVADVAANIVTYDRTTGELLDSSGTFMNKFAVVSEQPPSDLFANATTVTNHGGYTLTTSNLATNSNTFNAFDGTANAWVSGDLAGGYIGGANVFLETNLTQLSNLHPTQRGDWLAIEFPYKTTLRHMKLTPLTAAQFPASANIYATNNDLTWTEINYWSGRDPVTASNVQTITVNATEQFKKYALVATKAAGNSSNVALQDWQLFTESFSIDGGKVAMAQQAATGGETVMDQHGPHSRLPKTQAIVEHPIMHIDQTAERPYLWTLNNGNSSNISVKAGYTVTASTVYNSNLGHFDVSRLYDGHPDGNDGIYYCSGGTAGNGISYSSTSGLYRDTTTSGGFSGYGGTAITTTVSGVSKNGEWLGIETPHPIVLKHVILFANGTAIYSHGTPHKGVFAGSHDGVTWESISTFDNFMAGTSSRNVTANPLGPHKLDVNSTTAYKYHRMIVEAIQTTYGNAGGGAYLIIDELRWHGCNDNPPLGDTSVDTTFTSIMNTPQTTGANVYVDGNLGGSFTNRVTGPDATGTSATYDATGKYWELNGELTSNLSVEANTFLSGDAPHSLSMWFNSSNLVSNASNSCIFSLGTEERLDHVSAAFSNTYQTVQKLLASDGGGDDRFGAGDGSNSLGMSGDGSVVVVGSKLDDDKGTDAGAAYIFIKDANGYWNEVQKLLASNGVADDRFGCSTDISSDGNYIAIGARLVHTGGVANSGAIYIFKRTVGTNSWVEQQILSSSHNSEDDHFGFRVSISSDGTYVVATAQNDDESVSNGGAAYVFKRTDSTWNTTPFRLISGDVATEDYFGSSVEISNDGNFVAVGAMFDNGVGTDDDGSVYMFARTGDNTWVQQQKINNPSVSLTNNYFGGENQGVSISSDGTYLIVGAYGRGPSYNNGAVFFFQRTGSSVSDWTWSLMGSTQTHPLGITGRMFGRAVTMSKDGTTALVHARDDIGSLTYAGAVYVYTRSGNAWTYKYRILHNDPTNSDHFGSALDISSDGSYFIAGMFRDDDLGSTAGAAYIYTRDTTHHLTTDLKLQSNTWHNLTYAYQGEGGSRVTYLDGRKVAEDQAEDTFGDYPPFAMTGYSQGGYVVSASEEYSANYGAYNAFNNDTNTSLDNNYYSSKAAAYSTNFGSDDHGANVRHPTTHVGGTNYKGVWLQLEMPHRLKMGFIMWQPRAVGGMPRDGVVAGSNDGVNWYRIYVFNDIPTAANVNPPGFFITPNGSISRIAYKYIRIVVTNGGGDQYLSAQNVQLYGHRENDLVRLPDPTNVLKYPHIAMTGPAQRGYKVTVSTTYSPRNQREGWMAFNDSLSVPGGHWQQNESTNKYTNGTGLPTNDCAVFPPGGTTKGEWIKLELTHKIKVSSIFLITSNGDEGIEKAILYGSNNDSDWDVVKPEFTTTLTTINGKKHATESVTTSNYYKYLVLQVTRTVHAGGGGRSLQIYRLQYFGVEEGSVPIQIGGGNIDKVANFRVYDKFVGEDQALEIWDAQKDEFGRAKSSMTLQKGRLGIGTDEPQGRLAVLDEPHNLEEFPPRAMNGYKNYFEGHGEFCVRVSSADNGLGIQNLFDKLGFSGKDDSKYLEWGVTQYTGATGVYTGSVSTQGVSGEWLEIEMPYKIKLEHNLLYHRSRDGSLDNDYWVLERMPRDGAILGSNNGETWTTLQSWTDFDWVTGTSAAGQRQSEYWRTPGKIVTNSTAYYKTFRLVFSKLFGANGDRVNLGEWRLFGTREQGQSVLHDGQLTLTKSLTVPRIGPALDADDTPRRDRLVVEYNTSTNPTFEGAVRDTSGRGNDAIFRDTASYNAVDKAFNFMSHNKDLFVARDNISGVSGDILATVSLWFKTDDTTQTTGMTMFEIGNSNTNFKKLRIFLYQDDVYMGIGSTSYVYAPSNDVIRGKWTHVVGIKKGTGAIGTGSTNSSHNSVFEIYIDGVKKAVTSWTGTGILNMDRENQMITVGAGSTNSTTRYNGFDGHISNVKFWGGVALTGSEVKTLYDMGRCDEGHHVVNFSKTRVRGLISNDTVEMTEIVITNPAQPSTRGIYSNDNATRLHWAKGVHDFEWGSPGNGFFYIRYNGAERGYFHYNTGNFGQIDFTGQHRSFIDAIPQNMHSQYVGMIVCANKNKYYDLSSNTIITGNKAINVSEALPLVSLSNVALDKTCYGVISNTEYGEIKNREYEMGTFVSVSEKPEGDNRAIVNSVGEGAIWVVNTNGPLESGDYITTSNVAGYGQKQDDDVLHNYTVAKITMDCDFNPATQPIQQILRSNVIQTYYLGNVHHTKTVPHEFVTTTVTADDAWSNVSINPSDTTYAEWSNLEANTQNTYTLTYTQTSNVVYDTKYTLTTTANVTESDSWDRVSIDPPGVTYAEYSNLEANTQSSYSLTFTKTTTDEKTPDEWSGLESNTQSLYNMVYYQSVEEEVAKDYPGAVAHTRVTNVIENELDEHGQIQWEDHATETEKAYKIRYLDASGVETDSANVVHIAAFVGCTYHCG